MMLVNDLRFAVMNIYVGFKNSSAKIFLHSGVFDFKFTVMNQHFLPDFERLLNY